MGQTVRTASSVPGGGYVFHKSNIGQDSHGKTRNCSKTVEKNDNRSMFLCGPIPSSSRAPSDSCSQ
jgi:hypothetical protein